MGWGEKAIEIRSVETGHLDGVFMHKRAQRLKFLCERNDKVREAQDTESHTVTAAELKMILMLFVPCICAGLQVFFASVRSGGSSQVYFMTLNRNCIMNWWRISSSGQCVEPSRGLEKEVHLQISDKRMHTNVNTFLFSLQLGLTHALILWRHANTQTLIDRQTETIWVHSSLHSLKIQFLPRLPYNILPWVVMKNNHTWASNVNTIYWFVMYIFSSWFTLVGETVFSCDLVPNCEVCLKHSLMILQYILRKALFTLLYVQMKL